MMGDDHRADFERFFSDNEPRLRRAYVGVYGTDGAHDAVAEAFAWAWEHWPQVQTMSNPVGYLYRVGQSKSRRRRVAHLPAPESVGVPDIEPDLLPALLALPVTQRTAVWLVYGCEWRYAEVSEAMGVTTSTVGTHASRGLDRLRAALRVEDHHA
jgi:DNA-directed RNA polymerase specialized sigma24 family protein